MPELPEVETIKNSLSPLLTGKTIRRVELFKEVVVGWPGAGEFTAGLAGAKILGLDRRGKYLLIRLENQATLAIHLRMTGRLIYGGPESERQKHTHAVFYLDDGNELRFSDTRRFGRLWLLAKEDDYCFCGLDRLGPEPFSGQFCADYLKEALHRRKIVIKQALLDQSVVAGLGNIYVDEALFAAVISPQRPVGEISDQEWLKLAGVIPEVLTAAIKNRGTTFSDYRDGRGEKGDNFAYLSAYHREGQPCLYCGGPIKRIKVAGRSTFYCPVCQK